MARGETKSVCFTRCDNGVCPPLLCFEPLIPFAGRLLLLLAACLYLGRTIGSLSNRESSLGRFGREGILPCGYLFFYIFLSSARFLLYNGPTRATVSKRDKPAARLIGEKPGQPQHTRSVQYNSRRIFLRCLSVLGAKAGVSFKCRPSSTAFATVPNITASAPIDGRLFATPTPCQPPAPFCLSLHTSSSVARI